MKIDILAIGIHPDDVELSCSGTLLRHIHQGKTVGLLDLSAGELGTRGNAEQRKKEAAKAAEMMGARFREMLDLADGFFQNNRESLLKIIRIIRKYRPEIVLANALEDRHPDHGRAAKLVADACFYSGLAKIETFEDSLTPQSRWRPKALYHYIQDFNLKPDFVVDISEFMDKKLALVLAFESQFFNPDKKEFEKELQTPISGKDFMDFIKSKAASYGRVAGFQYAEGFNVARTPGLEDLFQLK